MPGDTRWDPTGLQRTSSEKLVPATVIIFIIIVICPGFASQVPHSSSEGPWVSNSPEACRASPAEPGFKPQLRHFEWLLQRLGGGDFAFLRQAACSQAASSMGKDIIS